MTTQNNINNTLGSLPTGDNSSITTDFLAWLKFQSLLNYSANAGRFSTKDIVSTYPLVYTAGNVYFPGAVLSPNGDVHMMPRNAPVGQKISAAGVVSTYSLVYTTSSAYTGGVLAPNGDIHFGLYNAAVGQKICTMPAVPFGLGVCCSPFLNKL